MRILSNVFEQELIQGTIAEGKDSAKDSMKGPMKGPAEGLFQMSELSAFKLMESIHKLLFRIHDKGSVCCNGF